MADFTLSPNMMMPVPTVGEAPGPGWATNIDASLSILDAHNHSSGQGVQINPNGININTDLPFNNNNATTVRSVNFQSQASPLNLITDKGCVYVSGVDLYYNDEGGTQIRITQGGAVAGSAGTITGLPSGTASASFSAGTFTFQSATNTPASMNIGPVSIGNNVANSKTVTIFPNAGIAANYNLSLPAALPAAVNYVTLDNSGNLSFNTAGTTGSDAVVLATSPTITTPSVPSGIIFSSGTMLNYQEGTYVPIFSNAQISLLEAKFQLVGNIVTVKIAAQMTTSFGLSSTITLPIAPAGVFSTFYKVLGSVSSNVSGFTGMVITSIGTNLALLQTSNTPPNPATVVLIIIYNITD